LRLQVGEGVEKAAGGDFAAEVAATLKQTGGA
jgi:translation elongation factor EF-Ts